MPQNPQIGNRNREISISEIFLNFFSYSIRTVSILGSEGVTNYVHASSNIAREKYEKLRSSYW